MGTPYIDCASAKAKPEPDPGRQTQNGPGTSPFRARLMVRFSAGCYRATNCSAAAAARSFSGFIERWNEAVKLSDQRPSSAM